MSTRCNTNVQNIQSCVTLTKGAQLTEQTNIQSPGTDVHRRGPTCQSPCKRRWREAVPGGRPTPWFGRNWTGTSPGAPWLVILPYPLKGGYQRFHVKRWREPTSPSYKRASTHPSQVIHSLSFSYTRRKSSSSAPLVSLE